MSRKTLSTKPDTRDDDATTVLLDALPPIAVGGRVLVVGDRTGRVAPDLKNRGLEVALWSRRSLKNRPGTPWPAPGPYDAAIVRLPRSKAELEMTLHASAADLKPGAPLYVYGANDEGIKSIPRRMEPLLGETVSLDARKHCRVVEALRPDEIPELKRALSAFREEVSLPLADGPITHASYPGVFAKGGLDEGTAALLAALPPLSPKSRVLDFACGAGVIAGTLLRKRPEIEVWMTDTDAVSVEAAKENVPGARALVGDSWAAVPAIRHFHYIVSNPPIHTGKGRDYTVLSELITGAPTRLRDKGQLWLVVQRQIPADGPLRETFSKVNLAWEDTRFRVWTAESPLRKRT